MTGQAKVPLLHIMSQLAWRRDTQLLKGMRSTLFSSTAGEAGLHWDWEFHGSTLMCMKFHSLSFLAVLRPPANSPNEPENDADGYT